MFKFIILIISIILLKSSGLYSFLSYHKIEYLSIVFMLCPYGL